MTDYIKEACVGNLEEAINAEKNGADRIELCAHLELGGTTPSEDLIREAQRRLHIPIRVMIRPRGGNFVYTQEELQEMITSIEFCKAVGVEGVVFGILDVENQLELEEIASLTQIASPMKVVIHKAIDETPDPLKALEQLTSIEGITTVLTSGGKETAMEALEVLKKMIAISQDQIELMPAGKISDQNLQELHAFLQARAYHGKKIVGNIQ